MLTLTKYIDTPVDYPEDARVSSGERCCWGCTFDTRASLCSCHGVNAPREDADDDLIGNRAPLTWDDYVTADCGHPYGWGCTDALCAAELHTIG